MEALIVVSLFASAVVGRVYLAKVSADLFDQLPPEQQKQVMRHAGAL